MCAGQSKLLVKIYTIHLVRKFRESRILGGSEGLGRQNDDDRVPWLSFSLGSLLSRHGECPDTTFPHHLPPSLFTSPNLLPDMSAWGAQGAWATQVRARHAHSATRTRGSRAATQKNTWQIKTNKTKKKCDGKRDDLPLASSA